MENIRKFPSGCLANGPFAIFHFANMTARYPREFCELNLGQFFPVTDAFQIHPLRVSYHLG